MSSTVMLVLEIITSWQNIAREAGAVGLVAFSVEENLLQLTSWVGSFCGMHVCIINHSNLCRTCVLLTCKMLLERPCSIMDYFTGEHQVKWVRIYQCPERSEWYAFSEQWLILRSKWLVLVMIYNDVLYRWWHPVTSTKALRTWNLLTEFLSAAVCLCVYLAQWW